MNKLRPVDPGPDALAAILGEGGLLADWLPSHEPRPSQLEMARRVQRCLERGDRLVAEAGTGTGKTLAYLIPAVLSGLRVVISTGTRTLQEQVFRRDIPLLLQALGMELPVVCIKGISNYLCRRRLAEARRSPRLFADPDLDRLLAWAARTTTGDRLELGDLPDDSPLWSEVSSTADTRIGSRCHHFEECFITRLRREASQARVIVVNHHLLLADLALRARHPSARVLPTFAALVLDEAHHLEGIATSFFGQALAASTLGAPLRELRRLLPREADEATARLAGQVEERSAELWYLLARELPALFAPGSADAPELPNGRRRLLDPPLGGRLQTATFQLDTALEALVARLQLRAATREELTSLADRLQETRQTLACFTELPSAGFIFWVELGRGGPTLHASPVEVGRLLRDTLFSEPLPIVLTSATLSTDLPAPVTDGAALATRWSSGAPAPRPSQRGLDYFLSRVGLEPGEVEELVLSSPFSFEEQALIYLPRDLPPPQHPDFIPRASERAAQLIDLTAGRALFLFTSYRNMLAARALLAPRLTYPLLCQGEGSRALLLDRFRREVDSVLLATASFWEGVDVAGESLSLVIIDKLPFGSPADPLNAARIELQRQRGADPFLTYQLPQAALALKQGFGRLIRHRRDAGIVAILDRRLLERAYGRILLGSLPPAPRTSDLLRVRAFARERLSHGRTVPP